jgi:hypothetical protein
MEPYNSTTKGKKYKHLNVFERYKEKKRKKGDSALFPACTIN